MAAKNARKCVKKEMMNDHMRIDRQTKIHELNLMITDVTMRELRIMTDDEVLTAFVDAE